MKYLLCYGITLCLLLILPIKVDAVTVKSQLVTDTQVFNDTSIRYSVYFYKYISERFTSGKVVLSSNPDGTGEAEVGELLEIYRYSNGWESFSYDAIPNCIGGIKKMKPLDITHLMLENTNTTLLIRFRRKCINNIPMNIGPLYLVYLQDDPTPTPFLDLPWDYKGDGNTFRAAALNISSYFDHRYPFLSTGINEPFDESKIVNYLGLETTQPYSSHDGYDYAFSAGALIGENVLASSSGTAVFIKNCSSCGNAISIDHSNGYQTRYYHLMPDGLITSNLGDKINVIQGQPIGKIGFSGNVKPQGIGGAHIHFMVVHDKNGDGNFDDNIPDGIVDPYGWQSTAPDPWENYSFSLWGRQMTGNKSQWLWKEKIPTSASASHPDDAKTITTGDYTIMIPKNMFTHDVIVKTKYTSATLNDHSFSNIIPSIEVTISDGMGQFFTQLSKYFQLIVKFSAKDIERIKPETLSFYSTNDGSTWQKEITNVNLTNLTAGSSLNHLTTFALVGEKLDSIPPITTLDVESSDSEIIAGTEVYAPGTIIKLIASDEPTEGSLGIEYTLYKVGDDEWRQYTSPFSIDLPGSYTISYFSMDQDGNKEESKVNIIEVQELRPHEISITYDDLLKDFVISPLNNEIVSINNEMVTIENKEFQKLEFKKGTKSTILLYQSEHHGNDHAFRVYELLYNGEEVIKYPENRYTVIEDGKGNATHQSYFYEGLKQVNIHYKPQKDESTVLQFIDGIEQPQIIENGQKRLTIYSERGIIKYIYK